MNTLSMLLHWHYLIFLMPFAVAALLLVLSTLRLGGHGHGGGMRHHAAGAGGGMRHHGGSAGGHHRAAHGTARAHTTARHDGTRNVKASEKGDMAMVSAHHLTAVGVLSAVTGIGEIPAPVLASAFAMAWGFSGYWANQVLLRGVADPSVFQMIPSMGIALGGGLLVGRGVAAIMGRLLPSEESAAVSRDALYGLTGRVVFPVTAVGGRVRVYDEFGTLHDEPCRAAESQVGSIDKGRTVMVVDRDPKGNLLVEATE